MFTQQYFDFYYYGGFILTKRLVGLDVVVVVDRVAGEFIL